MHRNETNKQTKITETLGTVDLYQEAGQEPIEYKSCWYTFYKLNLAQFAGVAQVQSVSTKTLRLAFKLVCRGFSNAPLDPLKTVSATTSASVIKDPSNSPLPMLHGPPAH